MKSTFLLASFLATALSAAHAADTTIFITGATSFRKAVLDTIKVSYQSSGQPFKFAHDSSGSLPYNQAMRSLWVGTFPGVSGTTTIHCSFNGSVEGIKSLVDTANLVNTIDPAALSGTSPAIGGSEVGGATSYQNVSTMADMAFSDVSKESTPYTNASLLPPSPIDSRCAVATFTMVTNEGAPAGFNNVTSQQYRATLISPQELNLFTGTDSDTNLVIATGRNDASGARTLALAETGHGITNVVQQYVVGDSTSSAITQVHRVPAGGYSASIPGSRAENASTIWGQDLDGNGGYPSGMNHQIDMGKTTSSTMGLDSDGSVLFTARQIHLLAMLGTDDAVGAIAQGAKALRYNGVGIAPTSTGLSTADREKITRGKYTLWSYEQFYRSPAITSGDKLTVYDHIKNNISANLSSCGIPLADMHVGRGTVGDLVGP